MCRMLVYDIKTVLILDEPVCVKHLPDQFVLCADVPFQKILLKKIKLLRFRLYGFFHFTGTCFRRAGSCISVSSSLHVTRSAFCRLCIIYCRFPDSVRLLLLAVDPSFVRHFRRGRPVMVRHDTLPHLPDEVILVMDFFFAFLRSCILFSAPGGFPRCTLNHRSLRSF